MRYVARLLWCVLAAVPALCGSAQAQGPVFPTKPIRMVVTAAPGGITDIMTRIMQEQIARGLGQQMIVENKPGAAGAIAVEYVARSVPDGHTLVIVNVGNAAIVPWIRKDLPYDPLHDLVGVAAVAEAPTFEQAGVSGYEVTNWFGVLAPKDTPRDVIQTLNSHIGQAFENPQVGQRLAEVGILPMKESVEQFQKRISAEHAKWRDIVRNAGITAQ